MFIYAIVCIYWTSSLLLGGILHYFYYRVFLGRPNWKYKKYMINIFRTVQFLDFVHYKPFRKLNVPIASDLWDFFVKFYWNLGCKRSMVIYPVVHIIVPRNSFPYFSKIPYQFLHIIVCSWNVSKLVGMKQSIPMFIQLFDNFLKSRMCGWESFYFCSIPSHSFFHVRMCQNSI